MASASSIAIRRELAEGRLAKAAEKIAKALGVEGPDLSTRAKQPDLAFAMRLEAMAAYMEEVAGAVASLRRERNRLADQVGELTEQVAAYQETAAEPQADGN